MALSLSLVQRLQEPYQPGQSRRVGLEEAAALRICRQSEEITRLRQALKKIAAIQMISLASDPVDWAQSIAREVLGDA